jgi:hypothetical protein
MELVEISPFLLILSEKEFNPGHTELTLDNFAGVLSVPSSHSPLKSLIKSILKDFPHKNYIPASYMTSHPLLAAENPCEIISALLEIPFLQPINNKAGLCFIIQNKPKVIKLADIVEENPFNMLGEVMKIALNAKKGKIGEDLIVNLTNGIEKIYRNTSENYLKTVCDKNKENKKTKNRTETERPDSLHLRALRDISNSGN